MAAYQNRSYLSSATDDMQRLLDDQGQVIALARELGVTRTEYRAYCNRATYLYWLGDVEGALGFAERAGVLEARMDGAAAYPLALLLKARIVAFAGDLARARGSFEQIQAIQGRASAEGHAENLFFPTVRILLE